MSVNDVPLPELQPSPDGPGPPRSPLSEERSTTGGALEGSLGEGLCGRPVSYTHLTLPTIE